jgi:hypothetical protein
MSRFITIAFAALLLAATCQASLNLPIPLPLDDGPSKSALWTAADTVKQIEADRKPYWALEEQLRTLPESKLKALFGASQVALPAGYALPIHHHSSVGLSGLGYRGQERSYFIPIADLGGVLVFPLGDKDFVSAVALYLKTDSGFIALRGSSDYPARRAWELQRTKAIRKHIQQVLSK